MRHLIPLLFSICLFTITQGAGPVALGDWGRITLPDNYELNQPFTATIEVLKSDASGKISLSANWMKPGRQFGGFLQFIGTQDLSGPGTYTFKVNIKRDKPNLESLSLSVYLSPDGDWKNRTASGTANLSKKESAPKNSMETLGEKSEQTQKASPFSRKSSASVATLQAGGFAATPGFEDVFDPGWPKRKGNWQVATWKQNGTQMGKQRAQVNAEGELVLTVKAGAPFQGGSIQSTREFGYGRWVARVKASAVPGVLNSVFTKDWDDLKTPSPDNDGNKGEVDIELLSHTYGPDSGEVHLAIHLKDHMPLWHLDIPLDFNPSDDFHEWGFDILPDRVIWHVDGKFLHEWKYTRNFRIDPNYEFFFNAWTMEKWIQGPPASDADYKIDWIRFYPLIQSAPAPAPAPSDPRPAVSLAAPVAQPKVNLATSGALALRPTQPASLQVEVGGGTVSMPSGRSVSVQPATLRFEAPEIKTFQAKGKKGELPPAPVNLAKYHKEWEPPPGALSITPRFDRSQTLILGSFYRYWRPETLVVKDAGGRVKVEGQDFYFDEDWGGVLNLNDGLGKPKTGQLDVSIEAALPRIDLIQVHPNGTLSVKKGETRWVCPDKPEADEGCAELATVFIAPWRTANNPNYDRDSNAVAGASEYAITAKEIFPIHAPVAVDPVNAQALGRLSAKLTKGEDVKIAFMGDSIMVGAEASKWYVENVAYTEKDRTLRGSFVYQLRQKFPHINIEPVHAFKGGETIKYAVNVYDEMVAPKQADLVVIEFGANDMDSSVSGKPKNSPEEFKTFVSQIVDRAQQDGADVMLITPLPRNPWYKNGLHTRQLEYQRVLYELAGEKNVALAPVFSRFQQLPAKGIPVYTTLHNWNNHPGDLGHALYAQAMLDTVLAAGSDVQ
ncbi:family 16 glycosylhydrolase [Kiritimatiellaeota bacterium B1221]|nr:family 16 glycosylhydrolase [Kiritimatiellaeota bacterium B1221]